MYIPNLFFLGYFFNNSNAFGLADKACQFILP